ncbi:MAG: hypothetical protein U5L96_16840 [Owenweeksia sp.]|nr:hypothetical protein [Owenweeksia sp.]
MDLSINRIVQRIREGWPSSRKERKALFLENLQILVKTTGMITWLVILILALMEVKRYYNIDLIPGYNSAFEEVYGSVRGSITKGSKDLK